MESRLTSIKVPKGVDDFICMLLQKKGLGCWKDAFSYIVQDYKDCLEMLSETDVNGDTLRVKISTLLQEHQRVTSVRALLHSMDEKNINISLLQKILFYPSFVEDEIRKRDLLIESLRKEVNGGK